MKKLSIQKCKFKDSDYILEIFNESVSKGISGTKTKVMPETHSKWLKRKLSSNKNFIFVAKINKIIIGYVRFDNIYRGNCEVSIALKHEFINKGYGSNILRKGILKLTKIKKIKRIKSKVKKNNKNSILFFLKNNFIENNYKKKTKNNYKYFSLSLS